MKVLIIGNKERYDKFMPDLPVINQSELIFCKRGSSDDELLVSASDAEVIIADAISPISGNLMKKMPNLKMIHSEGVAFDRIDINTAKNLGIYVCNNKGANAPAVAEQTLMLMLGLLRSTIAGDAAVRAGGQIQMKEKLMETGITDLLDCTVGLIGFGDIARETALRLKAFGSNICYYSAHRKSEAVERDYGMTYMSLDELLACSDIVSLHVPVTSETKHMVDEAFLEKMKPTSYLINTARGEIVDQIALRKAIISGQIAGAGLDTLDPEPVTVDNPLVDLPEPHRYKVLLAPHLGGITTGSFKRMHRHIWQNVQRIENGEQPDCIVNS